MKLALLLAVTACGRIDFKPVADADVALGSNDAKRGADGPLQPDAMLTACAAATPVMAGVLTEINTCALPDRLDGCGPAGTKEQILEFVPPASAGYNARAYDHGTTNITMVSIVIFNQACTSQNNCAAFLGTTYTQNVPVYFVLEASSGGCADVDFLVD